MKINNITIKTILFLSLLTILPLQAMDFIRLDKTMPSSVVKVTATKEITLSPGFEASSTDESLFHARIGAESSVFPISLLGQDVAPELNSDRNYIRTRTYLSANGSEYTEQIQYYDGLGRPDVLILRGISPQGNDLAGLTEYDFLGSANKQWLPTPKDGSSGKYIEPATLKNTAKGHYADQRPYNETLYDNSPLKRITAQKGAGDAWNDHAINITYDSNTANEVPLFTVNANNRLVRKGYYEVNRLYKTTTTDEDGKTSTEYKDKLGRVVMTRSSTDVRTCFVYNDLGQLAFVLPPLATDNLTANSEYADDNDVLKKYAYLYRYDERGNVVEKRLPGCQPVYMVYDKANRLILSQDGNQRSKNQWSVTKYDVFGRIVYSGILTRSQSRAELKNILDPLIITEQYQGANGFNNTGYSCDYFINEITPLAVNYYDNYDFLDLLDDDYKNALTYTQQNGFGEQYPNAKGLATGSRIFLLNNSGHYLTTTLYYDQKGQVIQTRATNYLGGYDYNYHLYGFTGNILKTTHEYSANNLPSVSETYSYTYDHAGRLKKTVYQIDDKPAVTLAANSYDELGRLQTKKRHNGADTETAAYNIRNQPTKLTSGEFEQHLYYNTNLPNGATALYNGNIAASTWTYDGTTRGYNYIYDALNRLYSARFKRGDSELYDGDMGELFIYDKQGNIQNLYRANVNDFDALIMTYNGNQLISVYDDEGSQNLYNLKEYHDRNRAGNDFAYDANGNMTKDLDRKIVTITYNLLNLPDTVQFSNGNQIVNLYAADGRKLRTDYYTQVESLNAPITEGNILHPNPASSEHTGTIYAGSIDYEFDTDGIYLKRIHNPEGYFADNNYHYYRKDHLGNNREVWRNDGITVQKTQYYPSGLPWASNSGDNAGVQPYKYNGKEFIEMHGLDEFDSQARMFYPAITRTTTMDPMAEMYYSVSPYAWVGNNPVNRIDPTGMLWDNVKDAENLKDNIDTEIKFQNKSIAKNQTKLDKGGLSDKQISKLEGKISESQDIISNLNTSKADIDLLGADPINTYAFSHIEGGSHTVVKGDDGKIYIQTSSDALSVHEITHVRQSLETGRLKFYDGKLLNAASGTSEELFSQMEIDAYQMQYSVDRSFPGNLKRKGLKGIDVHSVGNIWNSTKKDYQYRIIKEYSKKLKTGK
jgi:RHS repeat-associated protein